jgi:hypothetical protein
MNYDWRYDNRNGANSFWSDFEFKFDDEELIHLRHGDRASVIMGADPWASGGHMEASSLQFAQVEGDLPIELLIKSKGHFEFMEPVSIELRIRNLVSDLSLEVDCRLNPEHGGVIILIQKPNGNVVEYTPLICQLSDSKIITLKPAKAVKGEDRYSEEVFLGYGGNGFYFDTPGVYTIKAIYQGSGEMLLPSNAVKIRVGVPSRENEIFAQNFFSHQVGMNLYFNGSRSPHLSDGLDTLEEMTDQFRGSEVAAKVGLVISRIFSKPYYRVVKGKMVKQNDEEPDKVLSLTENALDICVKGTTPALNMAYHQLIRNRVPCLLQIGNKKGAKSELASLIENLTTRGVNKPIIQEIKEFEKIIITK